jgi:formylglycine-generating enzyme required for sulfatase activity
VEKDPLKRFQSAAEFLKHTRQLASASGERTVARFLLATSPKPGSHRRPLAQLFEGPAPAVSSGKEPSTPSRSKTTETVKPVPASGRYISKGVIEIGHSAADKMKFQRAFRLGRDFERAGNWGQASEYFRKALGACPTEKDAKELRAAVARVDRRRKELLEEIGRRARTAVKSGANRQALRLLDAYLGLAGSDVAIQTLRKQVEETPEGFRYLGINGRRHLEYECVRARLTLIYLPGHRAVVGRSNGPADEGPRHEVVLPPLLVGKAPVTNEQYARFLHWFESSEGNHQACHPFEPVGSKHVPAFWTDERWNRPTHPVVGVDWFDAFAFASWAGLELPTEAVWESVASAAGKNIFPWGSAAPTSANVNFFQSGVGGTSRVGEYRTGAAECGAVDLTGNVFEWCDDWYNRKFYSRKSASGEHPRNTSETSKRVIRGGSWTSPAEALDTRKRHSEYPTARQNHIGFRCILTLPQPLRKA